VNQDGKIQKDQARKGKLEPQNLPPHFKEVKKQTDRDKHANRHGGKIVGTGI
jgi:hypothetical protein